MSNFEDLTIPLTPYAGTSGWSGSDTSRDRAITQDRDGTTKNRQSETMRLVLATKSYGMTWKELSEATGWHHGSASGVLSVLHKAGFLERLTDRRNKCAIYVGLESVNGRKTAVVKTKCCKHCGGEL